MAGGGSAPIFWVISIIIIDIGIGIGGIGVLTSERKHAWRIDGQMTDGWMDEMDKIG